jgi:hypothetical protein
MIDKAICRNDGRCEYAIQTGTEGLAQCQAGKCSMPQPAHLTIPGALEWDGDNGTHGVVGTHSADGESLANHSGDTNGKVAPQDAIGTLSRVDQVIVFDVIGDPHIKDGMEVFTSPPAPVSAYTAVDMTTAAAGGFRDGLKAFSEYGNRSVLAEVFFQQGDEPFICAVRGRICVEQLEAAQRDFRENLPDELERGDGIYTFDFYYEKGQYDEWGRCEIAPGWGFDFVSYAAFEADDQEAKP